MNPISEAVQEKREKGIRRAAEAQDRRATRWSDVAFEFLKLWCMGHGRFTSEEVTKAFNESGAYDKPKDGRAWGGVYVRAQNAGLMHQTEEPYPRERGNGSPGLKWESDIYVKRSRGPTDAASQLPLIGL